MALLLSAIITFAQTPEQPAGSGTETDPYQIANLNNLYWMSQNNSAGYCYIQTADIDASSTSSWDSGAGFDPVYLSGGYYDGQGHTITGLYIDRPSEHNVGIFSLVFNGAIVKNLTIENANITGDYLAGIITGGVQSDYFGGGDTTKIINCHVSGTVVCSYDGGGIAGAVQNYALVEQCSSSATINGTDYLQGGIAGSIQNHSLVRDCYNTGNVSGTYNIGGLAGRVQDSSQVENSYSTGDISGTSYYVGGFIGKNNGGIITGCYSIGDVSTTSDYYAGGFAGGAVEGVISDCYSTNGIVSGIDDVGGFIGYAQDAIISNCYTTDSTSSSGSISGGFIGRNKHSEISNCYSWGGVEGSATVGGFAGVSNYGGKISNCYSIGKVGGSSDLGGFIGLIADSATVTQCFWDTVTSGISVSVEGTGKSTDEMHNLCTYIDGTDATWDFMNETNNGTDDFWGMNSNENNGYPFLAWQGYQHTAHCCGGSDTEAPAITSYPSNQTLYLIDACEIELPDYTDSIEATDNCDDALDIIQTPAPGYAVYGDSNTVTITVTDDSGNSSQVTFNVAAVDTVSPVITCVQDTTITIEAGQTSFTVTGTDFDAVATDNCNVASVTNDFNSTNTLDGAELPVGTTTITWTATDDAGNQNTCSYNLTIVVDNTSVLTIDDNISIYPNPTNGIIKINLEEFAKTSRVSNIIITDITGKIIINYQLSSTNSKIDISNQPAGIYFIKIQTENKIIVKKIIKK